jgi:hypothetical protein
VNAMKTVVLVDVSSAWAQAAGGRMRPKIGSPPSAGETV